MSPLHLSPTHFTYFSTEDTKKLTKISLEIYLWMSLSLTKNGRPIPVSVSSFSVYLLIKNNNIFVSLNPQSSE